MNLIQTIKDVTEKSGKKHPIVLITGHGGSGKSTLARNLIKKLPGAKVFEFDWYLTDSSKKRAERIKKVLGNGKGKIHLIDKVLDPLNWYNWQAFERDLKKFQRNGKISIYNAWRQKSGEKDLTVKQDFKGKDGAIICEGIFLLHPKAIRLADFVVLVDSSPWSARKRSEARDRHKHSAKERSARFKRKRIILKHYDIPYYKKYKKNADYIIKTITNGKN